MAAGRASVLMGLAWRNVWRNRRRTTLNVVALTVGMGILVLALGWIGGYHTYIFDTLKDFQTGEVQVMHREWYGERTRLPVDLLVPNYRALRDDLARVPGVRAVTGRVLFSARVSTGRQGWRSVLTAIDLDHESSVGVLGEYLQSGAITGEGDQRGLWVGSPVAEKAGIGVGDTVFLRAVNRHGVENLYDAPVRGVFSYGYPALDQTMVYVDMVTATELLDLDGAVTHLVLRLDPAVTPRQGVEELRAVLSSREEVQVRPWQDFARAAVSAVRQDVNSFTIMIIVMYLLIVLGILNSMSMSVYERTREIGTVRAIGMRGRSLLAMFALESLWQALIAAALALTITAPIAWWLANTGVDLTSSMPAELPVPFGERFRADFAVGHYLFTVASGIGTALLGAIIPARRASRLTVAEAMRTAG